MKPDAKLRGLFAQLDDLYKQVPNIACKGLCSEACGALPISAIEARRMQLVSHRKPRTTADFVCTYLTADKRCSIYSIRPLICRIWGTVKMLSCMHGCAPDRWLPTVEFVRLAKQIEKLGGGEGIVVTGPEGLTADGSAFADYAEEQLSKDISVDEERTKALRALHGGRIIVAVGNERSQGPTQFVKVERQ